MDLSLTSSRLSLGGANKGSSRKEEEKIKCLGKVQISNKDVAL